MVFNWFKRKKLQAGEAAPINVNGLSGNTEAGRDADDPAFQQTNDALLAFWSKIGTVDDDVITYIVNPEFMGAPSWPGRTQAFKVIRTKTSLIIASDGLSAPFIDDAESPYNGFGMEVFVEVPGQQSLDFDAIRGSAAFVFVEHAAQQIASWGGITHLLDQQPTISSEFTIETDAIPADFLSESGSVGVLFGMTIKGRKNFVIDTPLSPVHIVPATALTPAETLDVAKSKAAKTRVSKALKASGNLHHCNFDRTAVI